MPGIRPVVTIVLAVSMAIASASPASAADTEWTSGTTPGSWSAAGNWTAGVPDPTTNAYSGTAGAVFLVNAGDQGKTLFIEGPVGGTSAIRSGSGTTGTLSLADQLWINVAGGATLRIHADGTSSAAVSSNSVTLGADPGRSGTVILDSAAAGGIVTLTATDTITVGYDGSGSALYSTPEIPGSAGSVAISAATIQTSVLATAGLTDDNYIGTYSGGDGATLTATNLNVGVAGMRGGAENYGGTWNVTNTQLGVLSTSGSNYLTISDGGVFTNPGVFVVGNQGASNTVYVGYTPGYVSNAGSLSVTGTFDLVIGAAGTADGNGVLVDTLGSLSVGRNVVVGADGHANVLTVDGGSVTSGGGRIGVNAGSGGNSVLVTNNGRWTTPGTIRVGSSGTGNSFGILAGGTVTLTGLGNNFFVGYAKSAGDNTLTISGSGSTLQVKAFGADVVVSATQGSGPIATGNAIVVSDGGFLDANRLLVGPEGTIAGDGGTIGGTVLVGATGHVSPGVGSIGTLAFTGHLDLSSGGTLDLAFGPGAAADAITVGGTLALGGSSVLALVDALSDPGTTYVLANYGTLSGVFGSVTGLPPGRSLDYAYLGGNQIALVAVPEPGSLALLVAGGGIAVVARRRRRGAAG